MDKRVTFLKNEIVKYCTKMDQKGFVANHDGNISVKYDNCLLSTPTAEAKYSITNDMILRLSSSGEKIEGPGRPFSEIKIHISCYKSRADINAVIHAHPPYATARGLVGKDIIPSIPEAIVSLGDLIPVTPFAMPGDNQNDTILSQTLSQVDVFMMKGNGVLSVGKTLEEAYLRMELVEHLAKIDFLANQMGNSFTLDRSHIDNLLDKRKKAGLGPANFNAVSNSSSDFDLKSIIRDELKKALLDK